MNLIPAQLPGEMCVIATYFNPVGFHTKLVNYQKFANGIRDAGVHLVTVENAHTANDFALTSDDADTLVQVPGGDIMWQKERLLNIGLKALPDSCDKVLICDADVLFQSPGWAQDAASALESHVVIQPFEHCVRLPQGMTTVQNPMDLELGDAEGHLFHSYASGFYKHRTHCLPFAILGTPGFAWGFRRDVLDKHQFYDRLIVGSGDTALAAAVTHGTDSFPTLKKQSLATQTDFAKWRSAFYQDCQGSVGYAPGLIYHLWHGSNSNRKYNARHKILRAHKFDPRRDVKCEQNGPLYWSSDKPILHAEVKKYFTGRSEDAHKPPGVINQFRQRFSHTGQSHDATK